MEKSTIEIKMVNQENGEVTEIKFSTDDTGKFEQLAYELLHTFYKNC
jgi:hypothetical protein